MFKFNTFSTKGKSFDVSLIFRKVQTEIHEIPHGISLSLGKVYEVFHALIWGKIDQLTAL